MNEKLKPCPFCGNEDLESMILYKNRTGSSFAIRCYKCGARTEYGGSADEAIKAWNRRAEK